MKNLAWLIRFKYPNKHYALIEEFTSNEEFVPEALYTIRIHDVCNQTFRNFYQLEKFVRNLKGDNHAV